MPARISVDVDAVRDRHPQHFERFSRRRKFALAGIVGAFLLLVFSLAELGFADNRMPGDAGQDPVAAA